jgi:DNA-directed RNA polymerase specialized sigma24 family protein
VLQLLMAVDEEVERSADFEGFFARAEPRLRRALVAAYGPDRGRDAAAAALAYAWTNWERVGTMEFPIAYLFRVGQSETRQRRRRVLHEPISGIEPWVEPALLEALGRLSARQRTAVVLVHAFDWSTGDVAALMGTERSTVQSHLQRGLARLRLEMEVNDDELR